MKRWQMIGDGRLASGLLLVLLISGLTLRLWHLGELNFWGDENITALAVQGVMTQGYPLFPSGMVYLRSLPTTYFSALSATLFGFQEMALRLPSVLFSIGTIFLIYKLGQRFFSRSVGLGAALVLTFSYWDLEFARHARMYAPFAFFYTLTLYAIYRGVIERNNRWFALSLPVAIITVLLHELGGAVALLYLALITRRRQHRRPRTHLFAVALLLTLLAGAQFYLVQFSFGIPERLSQKITGQLQLSTIGAQLKNFLQFPPLPSVLTASPSLLWSGLAALLAGCCFFAKKIYSGEYWTPIALASVILILVLHQILLAGIILFFYLLFSEKGFYSLARREIRLMAILILLAFGFWTAYGLFYSTANAATALDRFKAIIKSDAGLPKLYYLCFISAFPLMAAVAGAGLLRLFYLSAPNDAGTEDRKVKAFFIFIGFVMPLLATGFIKTEWLEYRLNFHLNPLFALIYVFVFAEIFRAARQWLNRRQAKKSWRLAAPIMIALALVGCCEQIYPWRIYNLLSRNYGDAVDYRAAPGSHFRLMPDHQAPANYVKQNLAASDIVIVVDWLAQRNYLGRIDYWLRSDAFAYQSYYDDQKYFDIYTGTPVVASVEALQKIIAERATRRIWIITASPNTETKLHLSAEMLNFLDTLKSNIVFTGRDKKSFVYRLPAQIRPTALSNLHTPRLVTGENHGNCLPSQFKIKNTQFQATVSK